jgi:hypothetical protein
LHLPDNPEITIFILGRAIPASQVNEPRGGAFLSQECPGLAGQFARATEQAVQDEGAPDVAVQAVFGGESDPAEDLLTVAVRLRCRVPGRRLGQQ